MQKTLKFSKMHGLGNDIVIVQENKFFEKSFIQDLAHRRTGIGFDQLIFIEPCDDADFSCRIFNADGSEAEQCGNGMRCVARFVHENQLIKKNSLSLKTKAGIVSVVIHDYNTIQVNMGIPVLEQKNITINSHDLTVISMGNPHAILPVSTLENFSIAAVGQAIGSHSYFPHGSNVGFLEILNRQHIRLKTFERGVGETLACGSNACAAVVAGIWNNWLDHKVQVELALGFLRIEWSGKKEPVFMTGSAVRIFDGEILEPYFFR